MILASVHNLAKSFAGRNLFEGVSFGIEDGDRIGLVGPNGAGKSTLVRMLAGEISADEGSVSPKRGLRLGLLAQVPEFKPDATIMDVVAEYLGDDESKAWEMVSRLELSRFDPYSPVALLSGGWKKRVALARELAREPELLLLDEPTNHLDVSGILWLETFLKTAPFATLMITHDRLFLQRVVNHVLDLDPRNPKALLDVKGDYLTYLEAKEHELNALKRQEKVLKNTLRREKEWLGRGAQARQTKQKARIISAGNLDETVKDLSAKNRAAGVNLSFGENERHPQMLIEAKGLSKSFDGRTLFKDVDLLISPKTRLALLGDNGCGKSTIVRVLLGLEEPTTGTVRRADKLDVAYFEQNRETVDPTKSVLQNVCPDGDYVSFRGEFVHVRSYLDRFLFSGDKVDLPAVKLSGGEQARLRLAQLMLQSAQVLVLDEPTNDLDGETLDVLESALADFNGAVILVTHDRFFMDAVATEIVAFPVPDSDDTTLNRFASYFQWETWFAEETLRVKRGISAPAAEVAPVPVASGPKVKLSNKEKFELEKMEETILKLETEVGALTAKSVAPELMSDHKKLTEVHAQLAHAQATLDQTYQRWTELEAKSKG